MSTTSSPLVKKIEKLVAQEAKADEKNLKHATKELQKAEKAYNKSVKETQKAEKIVSKTAKEQVKTSKHVKKEESKFNNAVSKRQEAEKTLKDKTEREQMEIQDVQQIYSQLFQVHHTYRDNQMARAQHGRTQQMTEYRTSRDMQDTQAGPAE